ncbi:unnamed protein product (macronuclear) [Paramecium tetraurelia]|uniref:Uncharacterized protein n=1 Tax=Paramecium tetraurelia TaxID=5888 RepID=A0CSN9_PARTE|nr:uncharacterized protein GSPATT00010078001 [Paramecium tetraurelia]CAK73806.1 unnamed protein product [Paramecium tetraurelia]|eukprot:XP_001441203.1 hypothetical protein (macronuclear) [Paramecium tetraurelia strain d4-2]
MITFENNMMRLCQLKAEAQELIEIQAQCCHFLLLQKSLINWMPTPQHKLTNIARKLMLQNNNQLNCKIITKNNLSYFNRRSTLQQKKSNF